MMLFHLKIQHASHLYIHGKGKLFAFCRLSITQSQHAYVYAGLLANRLTPQRRRGFPFLHSCLRVLLLGRRTRENIAHHQVNILLILGSFLSFPTLLKWVWGPALSLEQVWEVVLLDGDDPLEVSSRHRCV